MKKQFNQDVFDLLYTKKGVLFDLDGTMIPTNDLWYKVDLDYFRNHGILIDAETLHKDKMDALKACANSSDLYVATFDRLNKQYGIDKSGHDSLAEIMDLAFDRQVNLNYKPTVAPFLHQLKQDNFKMGLVTMTTKEALDVYRYWNQEIKNSADMNEIFGDNFVTTEDVAKDKRKPHPDSYLKMLDMLELNASECIVFEDSPEGVEAGRRAGMDTVLIYDDFWKERYHELEQMTPYRIHSYDELTK